MPIGGNFSKPFNVSQPHLSSSDRTAHLKSKTKYNATVDLARNGGMLSKTDGSKHVGPVQVANSAITSASSYADLLDIAKGKYLLTPPPSSDLTASFRPANGDVYYGNFAVTDYSEAQISVTSLGLPTVDTSLNPDQYEYPNQLVKSVNPTSSTPIIFDTSKIVVDPDYNMFYKPGTCSMRNYFENVRIDPTVDVTWNTGSEVISNRYFNEQQAQRIIAHQAQSLRGFQYPTRVHFDLDNCDSVPSISPVAPDAPVIYLENISGSGPFSVTIMWLHGFDGGSPITSYVVYKEVAGVVTLVEPVLPQDCLNVYTLNNVIVGTEIWVIAVNCVLQPSHSTCTNFSSSESNRVIVMPPVASPDATPEATTPAPTTPAPTTPAPTTPAPTTPAATTPAPTPAPTTPGATTPAATTPAATTPAATTPSETPAPTTPAATTPAATTPSETPAPTTPLPPPPPPPPAPAMPKPRPAL
jgi:hypothetical protein